MTQALTIVVSLIAAFTTTTPVAEREHTSRVPH